MSQPFDRSANLEPVGSLDREAGQFWVGNPWRIISHQHNLSAFERNTAYLNLGDGRFADISFISGVDLDGDSRSVLGVDLDGDGMRELVVRQAGGGPLVVFKNRFPRRHWLTVRLRGKKSNALGIGARVVAHIGSSTITRELYPANTYFAQQPCEVHFGLGDANSVDRLVIHWPSGIVQEVDRVAGDQILQVTEMEPVTR